MCCTNSGIDPGRSEFQRVQRCALFALLILVPAGWTSAQDPRFSPPANAAPSHVIEQATRTVKEPAPFSSVGTEKQLLLTAPKRELNSEKTSSWSRTLGAIVSVVVSLAVVLLLFFAIAWLMRRGLPNSARRLPGEVVEVLGRAPLAGRQQMHLLRFGNKLLLVCASPSGVDTIGEITEPLEIDRLAGMCAQLEATSASTTFKQIFGQMAREKSPPDKPSARETLAAKTRRQSIAAEEATNV